MMPILAKIFRKKTSAVESLPSTLPGILDFHGANFFTQRRISPKEVKRVLELAASGNLTAQWELFAMMEDSWPRLAKNLAELRRSAARATYTVKPFTPRGEKPSDSAKDRAATVDNALRQWWPKPGSLELSFEDTLFHALDAYGKGISALEVHWQSTPDGILPRCAHFLAPSRYGWNADGNELGLLYNNGKNWQPFLQDHFLVGIWQSRSGAPGATAVLRALAPYWAGITFGWEWLLSNAQIFGVPFRWATYKKEDKNLAADLRDMLAQMGACGFGAFPEGTKVEFKEVSQNVTGNPQVVIQDIANKACDLLILGQELSGAAQAAGLGGGAANLQGNVRIDRLKEAAQWCADLLNYQLVPSVLRNNYGDTSEPPVILAVIDEKPDPKALAERDSILLNAGVSMPKDWFHERHGIPAPMDDEEVIKAPSQPPPALPPEPPPHITAKQVGRDLRTRPSPTIANARSIASAIDDMHAPFAKRLQSLLSIDDDTQFAAALAQLKTDFPSIAAETLSRDSLTKSFEAVFNKAISNP